MSDFHFGFDNDMWVYPPPNDDFEMPDRLEAVRVEGQLFVEASDAIMQVRALQRENEKLWELVTDFCNAPCTYCGSCGIRATCRLKRRAADLTSDGMT